MAIKYCTLCNRNVTPKRKIGIGTLICILFTGFIWVLFIPFYKKRCPLCHGVALVDPTRVESKTNQSVVVNNNNISIADELKKLNDLKDSGALTQEEFESHKKKLII